MENAERPDYLDPKILERIKRLDVRARLVVEGFITGQHKSPYSGLAVEFAGHRDIPRVTRLSISTGRFGPRLIVSILRNTKKRQT